MRSLTLAVLSPEFFVTTLRLVRVQHGGKEGLAYTVGVQATLRLAEIREFVQWQELHMRNPATPTNSLSFIYILYKHIDRASVR